jgi:hypothetical protein
MAHDPISLHYLVLLFVDHHHREFLRPSPTLGREIHIMLEVQGLLLTLQERLRHLRMIRGKI